MDSDQSPAAVATAATLREIRRPAPGPVGRWRNRLAMRLFSLIATSGLRERTNRDFHDAAYWRGHQRRRQLGFVKCEETTDEPVR